MNRKGAAKVCLQRSAAADRRHRHRRVPPPMTASPTQTLCHRPVNSADAFIGHATPHHTYLRAMEIHPYHPQAVALTYSNSKNFCPSPQSAAAMAEDRAAEIKD